jgi:hypothetical protein
MARRLSLPAAADGVISTGRPCPPPAGLAVARFANTFPQIVAPAVGILSAKTGSGTPSRSNDSQRTRPRPADIATLAPSVDVADRGVGITRAP